MIIKTILNFTGLYAVLQFCVITISHVFNIDIPSGAQIGLMIGTVYAVMTVSVSTFGRAPSLSENWILSVSVNLCALIISLLFLVAMLYFTGGTYAIDEFMMVFSDIPMGVFLIGFVGVSLVQVLVCLLVFGKAARRHLLKVQAT